MGRLPQCRAAWSVLPTLLVGLHFPLATWPRVYYPRGRLIGLSRRLGGRIVGGAPNGAPTGPGNQSCTGGLCKGRAGGLMSCW